MIQRIQTLWLLIASALGFTSIKTSVYSGLINNGDPNIVSITGTYTIPLTVCTTTVAVISLIIIFLYKNRKQQIKFGIIALILSLFVLFLYYQQTQNFAQGSYDLSAAIPICIPLFLFFALRGIYKDNKLAKSADKLRE